MDTYVVTIIVITVFGSITSIVSYSNSPFKFPYKTIYINITARRQTTITEYIDFYLIDNSMNEIDEFISYLTSWKNICEKKIGRSVFKRRRYRQFQDCCDDAHAIKLVFYKEKTRYKQVNYVRYPYKVKEVKKLFNTSYDYLLGRYNKLKEINFQCSLEDYNSNKQRQLMTKELRQKIAERDNFTCKKCGKYMPDGVGLHIDHIIPVSKGGKSVPSNLQVLCSKCNGQKSDKIVKKSESKS